MSRNGGYAAQRTTLTGLAGAPTGNRGVGDDDSRSVAYLVFVGLAVLLFSIVAIAVTSLGADDKPAAGSSASVEKARKLPVYWKVHSGDSYVSIAAKTGLTVEQIEAFNPYVDPSAIIPGQRLKLRAKVPKPKPKPLGPKFYTLRAGDSYGSIAAKTGKDITKLQQLNPKLKPTKLQPGDRLRLR
jgi:LysM repeat protein